MAAIGPSWAENAWVEASWVTGAWGEFVSILSIPIYILRHRRLPRSGRC